MRTSEARRAGVASTRGEAQCAATEHRAAEGEGGAKMRNDHCELRMVVAGAHEARAQWAKQREVSPMSKEVLQAVRRSRTTIANCGALALPSTSLSKRLF